LFEDKQKIDPYKFKLKKGFFFIFKNSDEIYVKIWKSKSIQHNLFDHFFILTPSKSPNKRLCLKSNVEAYILDLRNSNVKPSKNEKKQKVCVCDFFWKSISNAKDLKYKKLKYAGVGIEVGK
jgi:hypothetical protein